MEGFRLYATQQAMLEYSNVYEFSVLRIQSVRLVVGLDLIRGFYSVFN